MKIRPRYAKTLMLAHRRNHSSKVRRAVKYYAFIARLQYGRRPNRYYWHRKAKPLTEESLVDALKSINGFVNEKPTHFFIGV